MEPNKTKTQPITQDAKEIDRKMNNLAEAIVDLEDKIGVLGNKLYPVLGEVEPTAEEGQDMEYAGTPLGKRLVDYKYAILRANNILDELHERCEL